MSASVSVPRVGVRPIGARGSVAKTVVAAGAALTPGLHPPSGLITDTPPSTDSGLAALTSPASLASLVLGGHETVDCPLPGRAEALAAGRVLPHDLTAAVNAELAAAVREISPGDRREPRTGSVDAGRSGEQW